MKRVANGYGSFLKGIKSISTFELQCSSYRVPYVWHQHETWKCPVNLITKSSRIGRGLLLIMMGVVLIGIGGCAEQGAKAPSAEVESDVTEGSVLTLSWTGLSDDMFNTIIYTRLQAVKDGYKIGPYEAFVREDGSARIGIDEAYDPSEEWTVSYWIDVDNNQLCEEGDVDILRQHALPLGADSATLDYTLDAAPDGLCDGALYGFSNYEPRS